MTITQQELAHFSGTTQHYYLPNFPNYHYTDGIRYLIHNGATWLISDIFLYQRNPAIMKHLEQDYFQHWKLRVNEDNSATLSCDDGNGNIIKQWEIDYTDFPLSEIRFYLIDKVLMLPSEY